MRLHRGLLLGALGVLGFSGTLVVTRVALRELDPTFVALGRALVAAVLAAGVLAWRRAPWPTRAQWPGLGGVALGVVVGFPWLITLALRTMPAAHGAVIVGLLPLTTSVLAVLRTKERPSLAFWAASVAGVLGILAFAVTRGASGLDRADLLALGAVLVGGLGYAEGGRLARELGGPQVICWALLLSAPVLAVPAAVSLARTGAHASLLGWACFGYVSVVSMFLGFFAFYAGMAEAGIARVSQLQLAQPVLTVLWSALFLHEHVDVATVGAALFVVACVLVTVRTRVGTRVVAPEAP